MRDYLVLTALFVALPFCFARPYIGVYAWYVVAFLNPHRFTWGIAYNFPVAQCVAIPTLLGILFMKKKPPFPREPESRVLLLFMGLFTVNTFLFAEFPDLAREDWNEVMKILLMTLVTLWIIDTPQKLRYLVIIVTLSVAVFAIKAVPWAIATGGQYMLRGPPQSFIAANNSMGMALNMTAPLTLFLARNESRKYLRWFYYFAFWASILGVVLTYSRGSFLALAAVLLFLTVRLKRKVLGLAVLIAGVVWILAFVPDKWARRMETIATYEQDRSAMERIETWKFAWKVAVERPLTGGGFQIFRANPTDFDAHSNYFGILAEQGFPSFFLYLYLLVVTWRSLTWLRRRAPDLPGFDWIGDLAMLMQVSLVGYAVNGLTINRQYFDFFYVLVAITVIAKTLVRRALAAREAAEEGEASGGDVTSRQYAAVSS